MDLNKIENSSYLISMTPIERIIEAGFTMKLNENTRVLDLCCGYGEMLKVWAEYFNIKGTGIDLCTDYIKIGTHRLEDSGLDKNIILKTADVNDYHNEELFDVACICGVGDLFEGIDGHISMLEKHIKPNGKIIVAECYSLKADVPKELTDFEGQLYTLEGLYALFKNKGYYISYMSTGTNAEWERYITWDARNTLVKIRANQNDKKQLDWLDKWYQMYFKYRRDFEGWGFFVLERI